MMYHCIYSPFTPSTPPPPPPLQSNGLSQGSTSALLSPPVVANGPVDAMGQEEDEKTGPASLGLPSAANRKKMSAPSNMQPHIQVPFTVHVYMSA